MPRSIVLKTALPGPRSAALLARRGAAVPGGIAHATPVFAERAEGALLTDVDGNVETRTDTVSVFNGPLPEVVTFEDNHEEIEAVGRWIAESF